MWTLTCFCRLFLLNETARVVQNDVVSCTVHEKKEKGPKWCRFDGTVGLLLPLDARSRGRRRFFFLCHRHLSLQKDVDSLSKRRRPTPLAKEKLSTCWRGGGGEAAQWPPSHVSPLFLPIKTGEEKKKNEIWERGRRAERKKTERKEKRVRVENRGRRPEKKSWEKNEKQRREEEEGAAPLAAANHQRRCQSPPATPPTTATTTGKPFFPFFFFGFVPACPPLFT